MQVRHPCMAGGFQRASPCPRRGSSSFHTHSPRLLVASERPSAAEKGSGVHSWHPEIPGLELTNKRRREMEFSLVLVQSLHRHDTPGIPCGGGWRAEGDTCPRHPRGSPQLAGCRGMLFTTQLLRPCRCGCSLYNSDGAAEQFISINKASR